MWKLVVGLVLVLTLGRGANAACEFTIPMNGCTGLLGSGVTRVDAVNAFEALLNIPLVPDSGDRGVSCLIGAVLASCPQNLQLSCTFMVRDPIVTPSPLVVQGYFLAGVWPIDFDGGTNFPTTGNLSPNQGLVNTVPGAFQTQNAVNILGPSILTAVHNNATGNDCGPGADLCSLGMLFINLYRTTDPSPDPIEPLTLYCASN